MGTKAEFLAWVEKQVGTVGGAKYWQDAYGWSGGGLPFCAVGITDALKQTNTTAAYFPSKVAFDTRDKGVIGNAWVDKYALKPGDLLSFDWDGDGGGDHVGIVHDVLGYGYYKTIEFNVSNMVDYRYRYASSIIGGIRPNFTDNEEEELYAFATVKKGSKNNTVKICQAALNVRNSAGLEVDGYCGPITDTAIRNYQKKKGLYVDGECGPKTWAALLGK